jgi:hypothetical protein
MALSLSLIVVAPNFLQYLWPGTLGLSQEPRTFDSFDEAAAEAAVSRLYGGIHFSFDNDDGLASGQCIGQTIHDRVSFKDDDDD